MHGRALAARFEALDVNADGYLDEADYTALATRLVVASGFAVGNGVDSKVRDRYLALWETLRLAMDSDGDRRVSRAEFIAAVAAGTAGDGADFDRAVAAVASAVVDLADFDDDDRLDEAEFQKLFAALGVADIDSVRDVRPLTSQLHENGTDGDVGVARDAGGTARRSCRCSSVQ